MWCYYLIIIEVYDFEPVLDTADCCLVFLREHEPYEILIIHLILCSAFEFSWNLIEYSIDSFSRQGVTLVPRKVLLVYQEVVVRIQLPKSAIQYIKMLI